MDLAIAGKTALVTGASMGIGRAIAVALSREGVKLAHQAKSRGVGLGLPWDSGPGG